MRLYALTICAAGLFLAVAGAAEDDLAKLAGIWKLVSAEVDGKPLTKEEFDDVTIIVSKVKKGECKSVVKNGEKVVSEAAIANLQKAGEDYRYDMIFAQGPHKGKTLRGIVRVDGDTLTTCWHGGEGYPTKYTGAKGSGCALRILKRVADNDLAKLPGTWKLIALGRNGKAVPTNEVADELVITRIEGDKRAWHVIVNDRGKVRAEATIKPIKGVKDEKHDGLMYTKFDVAYSKGRHRGKTLHASIHVDGDTLKAFWTIPDEGGEEAAKTFHTFQRAGAAHDDLAKLPGTWRHASAERDGKPLSKEEFAKYPECLLISRIQGEKSACRVSMKMGDKVVAEATLKRSEGEKGVKGNQYDATYSKGRHAGTTLHAILQVDGDTLKACWTKPDEGGDDASKTCHTFQRVRSE